MNKMLRVWDRSRAVKDWDCPRSRYWGYEYGGKGLVNPHTSLELFIGTTVHDGLAALAAYQQNGTPDPEEIFNTAREQVISTLLEANETLLQHQAQEFAKEQAALAEGLLRGYYKLVWPRLMEQYRIVAVEQELNYEHDGLLFMAKPDLLLADKDDVLTYLEYKTTSSKKEEWINSWETAIQLHSTVKAIEAVIGSPVQQVIVQGLYKGYASYGKQNSPFCYAYKKAGNPPFTQDQISYEYKSGMKKFPSWELPGGVAQWVADMPDEVLAAQYPQTPPIYIKQEMVDAFFRQRTIREFEISNALQMIESMPSDAQQFLDGFFPQRFDRCQPAYGHGCMFRRICHGGITEPLENGYSYREPHHEKEMQMFEEVE